MPYDPAAHFTHHRSLLLSASVCTAMAYSARENCLKCSVRQLFQDCEIRRPRHACDPHTSISQHLFMPRAPLQKRHSNLKAENASRHSMQHRAQLRCQHDMDHKFKVPTQINYSCRNAAGSAICNGRDGDAEHRSTRLPSQILEIIVIP